MSIHKYANQSLRRALACGFVPDWLLRHPRVCGLNVPWNIRVIPSGANLRKSNGWCEWHGDLFSEPELFRLF